MFRECKIHKAWTTNIHLQLLATCSALGNTRILTNLQKYLCTFQLFIVATKIRNFWSQQKNLIDKHQQMVLHFTVQIFWWSVLSHTICITLVCVSIQEKGLSLSECEVTAQGPRMRVSTMINHAAAVHVSSEQSLLLLYIQDRCSQCAETEISCNLPWDKVTLRQDVGIYWVL